MKNKAMNHRMPSGHLNEMATKATETALVASAPHTVQRDTTYYVRID